MFTLRCSSYFRDEGYSDSREGFLSDLRPAMDKRWHGVNSNVPLLFAEETETQSHSQGSQPE